MLLIRFLVAAAIFAVAAPAIAQIFSPCTVDSQNGIYVAFDPSVPDASQSVAITFGKDQTAPIAIDTEVQDHIIEVNVTGFATQPHPPPQAFIGAVVGPLAAGLYTVNFYVENPFTPRFLAATTFLTVLAAPGTINAVPTLSLASLITLMVGMVVLRLARPYIRRARIFFG